MIKSAQSRRLFFEVLEKRELLSAGRPTPPGLPGDNVAQGCSYTFSWEPNATTGCLDSGDATQLTDGLYAASGNPMWIQQCAVGWQETDLHSNTVEIVIDLGVVQPIQGVKYSTAAGVAGGVAWPTEIQVLVSNDNIDWYYIKDSSQIPIDLVSISPPPPAGDYTAHSFVVDSQLTTHGRYVKFRVVDDPYVFADEIEVYRGADSLLGSNIALGCSYTLSPSPNVPGTTDPGDLTQLTDGQYTSWVSGPTAVAWEKTSWGGADITIDLGSDQSVEGAAFHTVASKNQVYWPRAINVLVSIDGVNFYSAGEVISLSADHGLPYYNVYETGVTTPIEHSYWTDRLSTHGRYVKIVAAGYPYIFVDEIEVYSGRSEMLSLPYSGSPLGDYATFVQQSQQRAMEIRRVVLDAQSIQEQVDADANLAPAQRAQFTTQLQACILEAMYENTANNVVLPINNLHAQVYAIQAALWRAQGLTNLTAWATESQWDFIEPTQAPNGILPELSVEMMLSEFRSVAFNLSNPTSNDLTVTLRINGLLGGANPSYITVREVAWIDTQTGKASSEPLPDAQQDANGNYLIHIPSGMTRQVWLTFNPTTTEAGVYRGTIVVDGGSAGVLDIPLDFRLVDLVMPSELTLGLMGWDYSNVRWDAVTTENREEFIAIMNEYFVDTAWGHKRAMPYTTDFSYFDSWIAQWRDIAGQDARKYLIYLEVGTTFNGYTMGTSQFNNAVGAWISAWVAHWSAMGLAGRVGLCLVDEPHTSSEADKVINWANAIKATEPSVIIWENPTWSNPSDGSAMAAVVDVLCPNWYFFVNGSDSYRQFYEQQRDAGKTLNFYTAYGARTDRDPYSFYRMQAWTSFQEGAVSVGFWSFMDQGGSLSWTTTYPKKVDVSPLFIDTTTITTGKGMEAIREGLEDYEYLQMLKDRIDEMTAMGCSDAAIRVAQSLLDKVIATTLDDESFVFPYWTRERDRTVADVMRVEVLDMLETLSQFPAPAVVTQPVNQAVDVGQKATFVVAAAAAGPVTWQWQQLNGQNWEDISGATEAGYTKSAVSQADDGMQFRVVVTNAYGSVTSVPATLYVNYGLEVWWKLDESSGTATDSSGKGHTGTLTNGPSWLSSGGILNGALSIDGVDSYLQTPSTSALKYTGDELTLSTWVYIDPVEINGGCLISKPWNNASDPCNYQLGINSSNEVYFSLAGSSPASAFAITSPNAISSGAWHHVAATVDDSKTMILYIDGVQVSAATHAITAWAPTDGNKALVIGSKYPYSAGTHQSSTLYGKMDNVRIYTHTLSAEAIADQARCPVGYWKFDDGSGDNAADTSGNENTGVLTCGPMWTGGEIGGAILFDGTNDYVSVPSTAALKYTGGELTLIALIYIDPAETTGGYLISKPWNSNSQYNYGLQLLPDKKLSFILSNGTSTKTVLTSEALSAGIWYQVAATVDAVKKMTIYVDGVEKASLDSHRPFWS